MARQTTTRRLSTDERRRQLLVLAMGLFSERAYDEVSTTEIAEKAGISHGLLFHYFPTKRDLYLETVREVARRVEALTEMDPEQDPVAALRDTVDRFLAFVEENAALYRALLRGGIGADPEMDAIVDRVRRATGQRITDAVGLDRPPTPALRSRLYGWVGYGEAVTLDWIAHGDLDRAAVVNLFMEAARPVVERAMAEAMAPPM